MKCLWDEKLSLVFFVIVKAYSPIKLVRPVFCGFCVLWLGARAPPADRNLCRKAWWPRPLSLGQTQVSCDPELGLPIQSTTTFAYLTILMQIITDCCSLWALSVTSLHCLYSSR